jgi:hypothetical protein
MKKLFKCTFKIFFCVGFLGKIKFGECRRRKKSFPMKKVISLFDKKEEEEEGNLYLYLLSKMH